MVLDNGKDKYPQFESVRTSTSFGQDGFVTPSRPKPMSGTWRASWVALHP